MLYVIQQCTAATRNAPSPGVIQYDDGIRSVDAELERKDMVRQCQTSGGKSAQATIAAVDQNTNKTVFAPIPQSVKSTQEWRYVP